MTTANDRHREAIEVALHKLENVHAEASAKGPSALSGSLAAAIAALRSAHDCASAAILQERAADLSHWENPRSLDWTTGPGCADPQWRVLVGMSGVGDPIDEIADDMTSFEWRGRAKDESEAKAAALRDAGRAWTVLTAIAGKPSSIPGGITSRIVCEYNDDCENNAFAIGDAMICALSEAGIGREILSYQGDAAARVILAMTQLCAAQLGHPDDMSYLTLKAGVRDETREDHLQCLLEVEALMEFGGEDDGWSQVLRLDEALRGFMIAASICQALATNGGSSRFLEGETAIKNPESATLRAAFRQSLKNEVANNVATVSGFLDAVGLNREAASVRAR